VDVAFGRARGEKRAAPYGARPLRDETLTGLQALDERLRSRLASFVSGFAEFIRARST